MMGADPVAMCGNCREVVAMFSATRCVSCINELYGIDINSKEDRVLTSDLQERPNWSSSCGFDGKCEHLEELANCVCQGHRVLIDPCW